MATPEQAKRLGRPVGDLGGRFMADPASFARAGEVGLEPGLEVYVVGRFGVLGRVDADVVAAAAVFWHPDTIRAHWEPALDRCDPREVGDWYGALCAGWGREHLSDAPGLDRWCELAGRVVDGAPVAGAPTFAGWRAQPRPDDVTGRAALMLHVLRELRFARHANAAVAAGLDPRVAVLATPGTEGMIAAMGWSDPQPEITDALRALRGEVEETTNRLAAEVLGVLSDGEAEELAELAEGMVAAAT